MMGKVGNRADETDTVFLGNFSLIASRPGAVAELPGLEYFADRIVDLVQCDFAIHQPAPGNSAVETLVEDEPAQREVLSYNLEAEGFRVASAGNGEEALLMMAEENPDIVLNSFFVQPTSC